MVFINAKNEENEAYCKIININQKQTNKYIFIYKYSPIMAVLAHWI